MRRRERLGICVKCKVRKARRAKGPTCESCYCLIEAEGTAKKLGIELPRHKRWREQIANYNELIKKGMRHKDIAALWGYVPSGLSSVISKRARFLKLKVKSSRIVANLEPVPPPPGVDHGGGNWGVPHCKCDPCIAKRRYMRMMTNRRYRLKKKQEREAEQTGNMPS